MSMITTTYPLPGTTSEMPSAMAVAKRARGFWGTTGWFAVAMLTFFAAAIGVGFVYGLVWAITHSGAAFDATSATFENTITLVSMSAAAAMLAFAARRSGTSMREYLGLVMPKGRHVLIAFGAMIAFGVLVTGLAHLFPSIDQSDVMNNGYRGAMASTTGLVLYWLVLVVSAPVAEEIIFRGFLFRGWSESRLGAIGALILSSLVFGAIHLQYSIQGMALVFGLGLLFGIARWRSGSTVLTILMHAVWNLTVGVAVALSI